MGYRSDVAYVIAGKKEDIISFILLCRINHPETKQALDECTVGEMNFPALTDTQKAAGFTDLNPSLYIGFEAIDVKWYESYEGVICHNRLFELASEHYTEDGQKCLLRGRKCIIGESDDDTSTDEFGDGNYELYIMISVQRNLAVDMNLGKRFDVRESMKELEELQNVNP